MEFTGADFDGNGTDREVAMTKVVLDSIVPQLRHVDLPRSIPIHSPPGRILPGQLERNSVHPGGHHSGKLGSPVRHCQVEIGDFPP
jgi:hypothetical protein